MINKELSERLLEHSEYAEFMARELRAKRPPPKPLPDLSHLTPEQKADYYLSMQPMSTVQALAAQKTRDPSEDFDWLGRPLPPCVANPDAGSLKELVGTRSIDPHDADIIKHNKMGKNQFGDSEMSTVTDEKREKAVIAFTYSKPAELTEEEKKKVTKLTPMQSTLLEPEAPKKSFWSWLTGKAKEPENKVKTKVQFKGNGLVIRTYKDE